MSGPGSLEVRPPYHAPQYFRFALTRRCRPTGIRANPHHGLSIDALSLTFPEGERLLHPQRAHFAARSKILLSKRDVEAFASQESIHRANTSLQRLDGGAGIPVRKSFERLIRIGVNFAPATCRRRAMLAATCAYEHYTALFAECLLGDAAVWQVPIHSTVTFCVARNGRGRAQAVAFDVYKTAATTG